MGTLQNFPASDANFAHKMFRYQCSHSGYICKDLSSILVLHGFPQRKFKCALGMLVIFGEGSRKNFV